MWMIKNIFFKTILYCFFVLFQPLTANSLPFNWTNLNPANSPTPREFATITYDSCSGQLILFGGSQSGNSLNDTWLYDSQTNLWTNLNPSNPPPPRNRASMIFSPANEQLILFGGSDNGTPLGDTWSLDLSTGAWIELNPSPSPPARFGATMDFNQSNGLLLLFGGSGTSGLLDDTWTFDTTNNANTWIEITPAASPPARQSGSMNYDQSNGQMILFGGEGANGSLNDTWAYNGIINPGTWTNVSPSLSPSPRSGAAMTFDPCKGQMILFGGLGDTGELNDTWGFNAGDNANTWTELTPSTSPTPRHGAGMDFDPQMGQLILFGGLGEEGELDDTWAFGFPVNSELFWINLNPVTFPPMRYSSKMVFYPLTGQTILFGGENAPGGTFLNDTWGYDSTNNLWNNLTPATPSPSPRDGHSLAFDPTTGQIVLFGGFNEGTRLNETWVYGFNTVSNLYMWTEVFPPTSPSPRNATQMTFDPCSGQIILFGGYSTMDLADTWAYDTKANTWTELFPTTSPPPRDSSAMKFDPAIGQIILFGGYYNGNLQDTWGYDSSSNTWTNLNPSNPPPARYGTSMDFDPCNGQIIIFGGGVIPNMFLNDTWTYNSTTNAWVELSSNINPGAREFASMAFDPASGQMILYGGVNNLNNPKAYDDTWSFALGLSPQITSSNVASFVPGAPFSFTISTIGFPTPTITEQGALPPGVTFVDNGNGTATLSGTVPTPGDYSFTITASNGLTPNAIQNFTLIIESALPPTNLTGAQGRNKFLFQTEYYNTLCWKAPSQGTSIVSYRIYRNIYPGNLIAEISNSGNLCYLDHDLRRGTPYTYYIVSVDQFGNTSEPAIITIK